jgi:Tfp pilus assembly protein PilE
MKGGKYKQAFTIIEIMLVLAITGLLFIGLVSSFQATIRRQRYNDSVMTAQNIFQEQYDLVSSVQNGRETGDPATSKKPDYITCSKNDASKVVKVATTGGLHAPGMSACLVYGRLIEFANSGRQIKVSSVIGLEPSKTADYKNKTETEIFKDSYISVEKAGQSEPLDMQWGSWLREPTDTGKAAVTGGMLILKSPVSGTVWTYNFTGAVPTSGSLVGMADASKVGSRRFCVISDDVDSKGRRAIIVGAGGILSGANSSAVQLAPLDVKVTNIDGTTVEPSKDYCGD